MPKSTATGFEALAQPFSKSVITLVTKGKKRFSNVAPHHYIQKLIDALPEQYSVELGAPVFHGKAAVSVNGKVTLHLEGGDRVSSANGAEPLTDTDPESISFAIKNAQSDALKLALKPFGVGLDLYNQEVEEVEEEEDEKPAPRRAAAKAVPEEEEEEAPPAKRRTAASTTSSSGGWESKREKFTYPMGKNKGTTYADLECSFLTWGETNLDPDDAKYGESNGKILKCVKEEIKYRKANDLWEDAKPKRGSSKPTRKRRADEDDDDEEKF